MFFECRVPFLGFEPPSFPEVPPLKRDPREGQITYVMPCIKRELRHGIDLSPIALLVISFFLLFLFKKMGDTLKLDLSLILNHFGMILVLLHGNIVLVIVDVFGRIYVYVVWLWVKFPYEPPQESLFTAGLFSFKRVSDRSVFTHFRFIGGWSWLAKGPESNVEVWMKKFFCPQNSWQPQTLGYQKA